MNRLNDQSIDPTRVRESLEGKAKLAGLSEQGRF